MEKCIYFRLDRAKFSQHVLTNTLMYMTDVKEHFLLYKQLDFQSKPGFATAFFKMRLKLLAIWLAFSETSDLSYY